MIQRRTTLEDALQEIETGVLNGVTAIVVNRDWWQGLTQKSQTAFRQRCVKLGVELRADSIISSHFVELASDPREPPLSTEQRV